jgi:protein CpxP
MSKKLLYILAISLSILMSPLALANQCGKGLGQMVDNLRLDDSQKAKIKPILEQLKTSLQGSATQIKEVSDKLHQQFQSGNTDQSALNSLVDEKAKIIGDIMKAKVNAKSQIYAVLNEDQKSKFQVMMKKKSEMMSEKWKNCHGDSDANDD